MAKITPVKTPTTRPAKRARVAESEQPVPQNLQKMPRATPPPPKKNGIAKVKEPKPTSLEKHTKPASSVDPKALPKSFKIVAGSYEKLLYGLDGSISLSDELEPVFSIKPIFIFPAHVSCIKAVAASPEGGKWLATGSSDEIVKVWDLRRRKEVGGLMHHEGGSASCCC